MSFNDEVDQVYLRQEKTVKRTGRAAGVGGDWSPAADFGIFTIAGGPIRITGLFGHVTAVFAGANAIPLITYGAANALCVVGLPVQPLPVYSRWDLLLNPPVQPTLKNNWHGEPRNIITNKS